MASETAVASKRNIVMSAASLFGKASAVPDLAMVTAGSFDDPSLYQPTLDIFTASAHPWDHMNPALAKFLKMPPMGG